MNGSLSVGSGVRPSLGDSFRRSRAAWGLSLALVFGLVVAAYWHSFVDIYFGATAPESLYSHAMFIPLISLFFVWRQRELLGKAPLAPSPLLGYPLLLMGCLMLLLGDFLGFMTLVHFSLLPVVCGLCFLMLGRPATVVLWFPLAFLFFMLPAPYSIISVISFKSKMLATESAVELGQLLTLNFVQDGSYVFLGSEKNRLMVGDVCGGMRSLIALLAFGALMAYISKTRGWARIVILLISPAVAIAANVARIFFLCVVGYIWDSEAAIIVHDASGIGIFAFAFVLLFGAEALLRKIAPAPEAGERQS